VTDEFRKLSGGNGEHHRVMAGEETRSVGAATESPGDAVCIVRVPPSSRPLPLPALRSLVHPDAARHPRPPDLRVVVERWRLETKRGCVDVTRLDLIDGGQAAQISGRRCAVASRDHTRCQQQAGDDRGQRWLHLHVSTHSRTHASEPCSTQYLISLAICCPTTLMVVLWRLALSSSSSVSVTALR